MHVAMLSAEYPPRWGGMGSTVYHLSAALAENGDIQYQSSQEME